MVEAHLTADACSVGEADMRLFLRGPGRGGHHAHLFTTNISNIKLLLLFIGLLHSSNSITRDLTGAITIPTWSAVWLDGTGCLLCGTPLSQCLVTCGGSGSAGARGVATGGEHADRGFQGNKRLEGHPNRCPHGAPPGPISGQSDHGRLGSQR